MFLSYLSLSPRECLAFRALPDLQDPEDIKDPKWVTLTVMSGPSSNNLCRKKTQVEKRRQGVLEAH